MQFYIAVFIGAFIYILIQLNGRFSKPDFEWKIFFKTNLIPTILNLVIGWALVFIRAELVLLYPITLLSALILGVSGQLIFKKMTDMFDKNATTTFGMNKQ